MNIRWIHAALIAALCITVIPLTSLRAQEDAPAKKEIPNEVAKLFQEEQYAAARELIEETLATDTALPRNIKATLLFQLGFSLIELEEYRESIEAWHDMLAIVPRHPIVWGNLGWAYYLEGDVDSAIVATEQALDVDATLAFAWGNLGLYRLANGDIDGMRSAYEMAAENVQDMETWKAIQHDLQELCTDGAPEGCAEANEVIKACCETVDERLAKADAKE